MTNSNLRLYNTDLTGVLPVNLVLNETHSLTRQTNIAVAPLHGAFYTKSMVVKNTLTNEILKKHEDYRFLETYPTLREVTGKQVNGVILIKDSNINPTITLSYQCVGGEFAMSTGALVELLNSMPDINQDYSWYNILIEESDLEYEERPGTGGKLTFEYMCFCLEKIRNAILWTDTEHYQNTINYVNRVLIDIDQQTRYRLDSFLDIAFNTFTLQVNKAFLGLDKVENLPLAVLEDGTLAATEESRITSFERNKYVALDAIVSFKNSLHDFFLSSAGTNIGKNRGVTVPPTKQGLFDMLNGTIAVLVSKEQNTAGAIVFDANVYPPDATLQNSYSIFKVSNNLNNHGGVFISSDRDNGNMYIGVHLSGLLSADFVWRKVIFNEQSDALADVISTHLLDVDNPHGTDKTSVKLNLVENLEPINADEILCLEQCRKYVTFDAFLLFMKTHMVNEQAAAEDPRNEVTGTDKVQIIYAKAPPVNMSGCEADPLPVPPTPPTPPEPFVIDRATVGISNVQIGRALDLIIAHVKGKVPEAITEIVTGILPAGITISVDVANPVFGTYAVKLTGTPTVSGIFATTIRINAVTNETLVLPIEFNIGAVDQLSLSFASTQTTITNITSETLTVILNGGPINSTIRVKVTSKFIKTAIGNEAPSQIEKIVLVRTNSIGNGSVSFPGGNASGSIQAGDWENWAQTMDLQPPVTSPIFIRTFV